jgi:hypothetical protein
MAELIVAHVSNCDVASVPTNTPSGWPYWPLAHSWASALEVFVVAHEYGHLLHGQEDPGRHLTPNIQWQGLNEIDAEGLADRLAARMIWVDATEETTDWAHIAPLAYFWFLARLEDLRATPSRGTHPSFLARLGSIEREVQTRQLAGHWADCRRRLEDAWPIAHGIAKAIG